MLDLAFNLSNDPLFYIVTFTLLINLSGMTARVFLCQYHEDSYFQNTILVDRKFPVQSIGQSQPLISGRLTNWISKFIQRKEGPQDDSDDHFFLFAHL